MLLGRVVVCLKNSSVSLGRFPFFALTPTNDQDSNWRKQQILQLARQSDCVSQGDNLKEVNQVVDYLSHASCLYLTQKNIV